MATRIQCAHCGRSLALPDGFAGTAVRCPTCKLVTEITPEGKGRAPSVQPPLAQPVAGRSAAGSPAAVAAAASIPAMPTDPPGRVALVDLDVPFGTMVVFAVKAMVAFAIAAFPFWVAYLIATSSLR